MTTLKKVAQKHGMECLFHEKPFRGHQWVGKACEFFVGQFDAGKPPPPG